ncbi:hypothetical protein LTR27_005527 [Elasticomyces elasticus]|nr:hypothetical protein LTR27_005527 [Elasticomyces elasticus]
MRSNTKLFTNTTTAPSTDSKTTSKQRRKLVKARRKQEHRRNKRRSIGLPPEASDFNESSDLPAATPSSPLFTPVDNDELSSGGFGDFGNNDNDANSPQHNLDQAQFT